jgi:uncharacterized membrane protein
LKRYIVLYLATLLVLLPLDFLFLGVFAKDFFKAEVGDMLGEVRVLPAVVFYLLYVSGILVFVSGSATATSSSTLLFGALFGMVAYATFDLTALATLRHWTWPVAFADVAWGAAVTAVAATLGLLIANALTPHA